MRIIIALAQEASAEWIEWISKEASKWTPFDAGVMIGFLVALTWAISSLRKTTRRRDRLVQEVKAERSQWEIDFAAEVAKEARGETRGPKDPQLAAWYENEKRQRRYK
jgi:hypothetical protein